MGSTDHGDDEARDRVMRLTQRLVAEADKVSSAFVGRHGMHSTDVNALIRVRLGQERGEPITAGRLGEELELTSGAVTALVDRLERSGNLRRLRDQGDRRRVILENTPEGHHLVDQYFDPVRQRSRDVLQQFSSRELDVISRYLTATTAAMTAHAEALLAERRAE